VAASRGGRPVLRDLDLTLERGVTAVTGPSGAGKSTLLRLLNRLADPDAGRVLYDGRDLRELDVLDLRRRAVLVPQLPAPLPGTVADNVAYGPRLGDRDADVPEALRLAGLAPELAARPADELSVGEGQRLMLARALALDPEVLLLDEPTAALDPDTRDGVERTLRDLADRVSMVVVTHDHAQADRIAERTVAVP
jgi:putative ABC transport system ATP-binding protein